jgi:hypothetical protein
MFSVKLIIIFFLLILTCSSFKLNEFNENPETLADLFEGDIVLESSSRNGIIQEALKWPKNNQGFVIVPYLFQQNEYSKFRLILLSK